MRSALFLVFVAGVLVGGGSAAAWLPGKTERCQHEDGTCAASANGRFIHRAGGRNRDRIDAILADAASKGRLDETRNICAAGAIPALEAFRATVRRNDSGDWLTPYTSDEVAKLCTTALKEEVAAGHALAFYEQYVPDDLKGKIDPKQFQEAFYTASLNNQVQFTLDFGGRSVAFQVLPATAFDAAYVTVRMDPTRLDPAARGAKDQLAAVAGKICIKNGLPHVEGKPAIKLCNLAGQKQAEIDLRRDDAGHSRR